MELNDVYSTIQNDEAEAAFYSKPFYFSYSSLNKLLWNPGTFYQMYVLGLKEERTDAHLVQGKITHALMLEEHLFNENFIVSPSNLPTGNHRTVLDKVFYNTYAANPESELQDWEMIILQVLRDINLHQSLKTDQQRIDKIVTADALEYWNFMKSKGNKTLIDQESYEFCKNAVDIIKQNAKICDLLGLNTTDFANQVIYNEHGLQVELKNYPFGMKGIIDNIKIDHDTKTIFVNDLKTSGKELKDFAESIEYYNYWLQAVFYLTMVSHRFADLLDSGYEIKFHFIVIDKFFNCYPFPVSEKTLAQWHKKTIQMLDVAQHHYEQRRFELPYQFDKGLVVL